MSTGLCKGFALASTPVYGYTNGMYTAVMDPPPRRRRNRATATAYSNHVSLYESDQGLGLLTELADRRGTSISGLLRALVREEAARIGLRMDGEADRPAAE